MNWLRSRVTQHTRVTCHFCSHTCTLVQPLPGSGTLSHTLQDKGKGPALAVGTASRFVCTICECLNVRDETGNMVDDPARWDSESRANKESWAKKGTLGYAYSWTHSADPEASTAFQHPARLPTSYAAAPFCSTCVSNQALQLHLVASYPDSDEELDNVSYSTS